MQQWIDFWKQDRMRVVLTERVGFGVVATAKMNTGTSLMEGWVEPDVEEPDVFLKPEGSLYGPASLLNAACHDCSNVAFEKSNHVWTAKVKKPIKAGNELLAPYTPNVQGSCPVCKCPLVEE